MFPFSIVITSLGREGAGLCASRTFFVCFVGFVFVFFLFLLVSAAVCDCGTSWACLLTLFYNNMNENDLFRRKKSQIDISPLDNVTMGNALI